MNTNYGLINQRMKPRLNVVRGDQFRDSANGLSQALPVALDTTILSGQLIAPMDDEWVLAGALGTDTDLDHDPDYYFAFDDSEDEDVIEAGQLPGISCQGQYEVETAFFKADETYSRGTKLTADTDNPGSVRPAADGEVVIGTVVSGPRSIVSENSHVAPFLSDEVTVNPGLNVLRIRTQYIPA